MRRDWEEKQLRIKNEEIEITYSYWDGSGHRRQVRMKKGTHRSVYLDTVYLDTEVYVRAKARQPCMYTAIELFNHSCLALG